MENQKKWYQSKTMWFSIAVAGIGILEAVTASLQESQGEGIALTIVGLMTGLLRYVTSQPIK
jgi:hypothetical protein